MPGPRFIKLLVTIALLAGGTALMASGTYGLTLFAFAPVFAGALAARNLRPRTKMEAAGIGALAALLASFWCLALGLDGGVCILMALPLTMPLGVFGSWLVYKIDSSPAATTWMAMLVMLTPCSLFWDAKAIPPVFRVHSAIEIAASPEQVWKHVVTFSQLPPPPEWYFKTGLAYPQRAHIIGSGVGAVRYCEFSTGPFVEPIKVWDEPRLLQFSVTANPAPMHEWSPYGEILPRHLHGYLISKQGEFRLTELRNHHTLLEGTTWYQHGLWPAQYWRWWSDAIIHRIHLRVLNHIRNLAEADQNG